MKGDNDDEFVRRVSFGDQDAVRLIYQKYQPHLTTFARRLGAEDPEGSADLAFFDGLRVIEDLHTKSALAFRSYLYTATRNRVISEHRKGRPVTVPFDESRETDPSDDPTDDVVDRIVLEELRDHLSPAQASVILNRFFYGYSTDETARLLGRSPVAVRRLQHLALKRLRLAYLAGIVLLCLWLIAQAWLHSQSSMVRPAEPPTVGYQTTVLNGHRNGAQPTRERVLPRPGPPGESEPAQSDLPRDTVEPETTPEPSRTRSTSSPATPPPTTTTTTAPTTTTVTVASSSLPASSTTTTSNTVSSAATTTVSTVRRSDDDDDD